ncbi:hypothetical protein T484DRAFT_1783542, partial [Baffinella frigidus]
MVNTVLATICAEQFKEFADQIEAGKKPQDVAAASLNEHWKVIFNGDGYDASWPVEADKRGIWRIDSGVDAMDVLVSPKNMELFAKFDVLSNAETQARRDIMLQHYSGLAEIEAGCMVDMISRQIIPAINKVGIDSKALAAACAAVEAGLHALEKEGDDLAKAKLARVLRLETMEACRAVCDVIETKCPASAWPIATYRELLFLDCNQDAFGATTGETQGGYTRALQASRTGQPGSVAAPGQPGSVVSATIPVAELTIDLEIQKLGYGSKRFIGAVADKYLAKYGESSKIFEDASWTKTKADVVAKAVLDWGR